MRIKRIEQHRVILTKIYDIDIGEMLSEFGSKEKFLEEMDVESDKWLGFVTGDGISDSEEDWIDGDNPFVGGDWEFEEEEGDDEEIKEYEEDEDDED